MAIVPRYLQKRASMPILYAVICQVKASAFSDQDFWNVMSAVCSETYCFGEGQSPVGLLSRPDNLQKILQHLTVSLGHPDCHDRITGRPARRWFQGPSIGLFGLLWRRVGRFCHLFPSFDIGPRQKRFTKAGLYAGAARCLKHPAASAISL